MKRSKQEQKQRFSTNFDIKPETQSQTIKTIKMFALSYNLAGLDPSTQFTKLKTISLKILQSNSDVVLIGFQEIFELKLQNFSKIFDIEEIINKWVFLFQRQLKGYKLGVKKSLLGLLSLIFIHERLLGRIYLIRELETKLGVFNIGNKGAIANLFRIKKKHVLFTNCHLTAGFDQNSRQKRLDNLNTIIK